MSHKSNQILFVMIASGLGFDCSAQQKPGQASNAAPSVVVVKSEKIERKIELPVTIRGDQTADLFAKVGGYVEEISVDIGDHVAAGQVLARLDIPEMKNELAQRRSLVDQARAEYQQADAAIAEARAKMASQQAAVGESETLQLQKQAMVDYETAEHARISKLVARGAVNRELLDAAKLKRDSAIAAIEAAKANVKTQKAELQVKQAAILKSEADRDRAESHVKVAMADQQYTESMLQYSTIKAPFDGVITKRWFDKGAFIQSADGNSAAKPILQVVDVNKVRASISVSMSQVGMLSKNDRVIIHKIDSLENQSFHGVINRFSAGLDSTSRMMAVEVDLVNDNRRLKPGFFGYATIYLVELESALVVPSSALVYAPNEIHVIAVDGSATSKRIVEVAFDDGKLAGVNWGLNDGDRIVEFAETVSVGEKVTSLAGQSGKKR